MNDPHRNGGAAAFAGAHASLSVRNCSSAAINHEIMALAYGD